MPTVSNLLAREILDSKGEPTVEVELVLSTGESATDAFPSGVSTGTSEALELRDQDPAWFHGRGVKKAVATVNDVIFAALKSKDFSSQSDLDNFLLELDGTPNKSRLGANAILPVSLSFARAVAEAQKVPLYQYLGELSGVSKFTLPDPLLLVMEGGKHGAWATDIQEFMVRPTPKAFSTFAQSLEAANDVYQALEKLLTEKQYSTGVGFEGAFCPRELSSNEEALSLICQAVTSAGYSLPTQFTLAVDVAASEFYKNHQYVLPSENNAVYTASTWSTKLQSHIEKFHISSIEDPFDQASWADWTEFNSKLGNSHQIVADDLTTTNVKLLQKAINLSAANAVIIKPNQIGTVTETISTINLAKSAGFVSIISHRAGETSDDFIADLCIGTASTQCKFGGPSRGERVAKYNRLLKIESELL